MSKSKTLLFAAALAVIAGSASAAPLGGIATEAGAAVKTEAQANSVVEPARYVCRYGFYGRRCWWEPSRPHFGFYHGPHRHWGHGGWRRWH